MATLGVLGENIKDVTPCNVHAAMFNRCKNEKSLAQKRSVVFLLSQTGILCFPNGFGPVYDLELAKDIGDMVTHRTRT